MKLLLVALASLYSSLLLADAFEVLGGSDAEQLATAPDANSSPLTERAYLSLMRYLTRNNKQHAPLQKRYGDFGGMPYYRYDKRNNGVWIWMPAQGYVSVPRESQAGENAEGGKPGKIMRYGK